MIQSTPTRYRACRETLQARYTYKPPVKGLVTNALRGDLRGGSFGGKVIVPVFGHKKDPDPEIGAVVEKLCYFLIVGVKSPHSLSPILIGGKGLRSMISWSATRHCSSDRSRASW